MTIDNDEARCEQSGAVNEQNCRYWTEKNPSTIHVKPLHITNESQYGLQLRGEVSLDIIFLGKQSTESAMVT